MQGTARVSDSDTDPLETRPITRPITPPRLSLETALHRVLLIVQPYLCDLVLIGGWVPYLHQHYGKIRGWHGELSLTSELDMLVGANGLSPNGRAPLAEILTAAGLKPSVPYRHDSAGQQRAADSAVWTSEAGTGEEIEFLVAHTGPFRGRSNPVPIAGQPGISAIMLPDIGLLERYTTEMRIPVDGDEGQHIVPLRIPTLGAYLVNKACSFPKRLPLHRDLVNPKRAKDLLYLRDLAAAGDKVIAVITEDIRFMLSTGDGAIQVSVDTAASNLEAIVRGAFADALHGAAEMFAERGAVRTIPAARSDVAGHIRDLFDMLETFRSPFSPPEPDE